MVKVLWRAGNAGTIAVMFGLPPKAKEIVKHPAKFLGLLVIAGLLLYFAVINPILNKVEKDSFEESYVHLERLATNMQTSAGKAEEIKTLKSCGYSGQTFDRGWRSCSVAINMSFPSFDLQKSNDYFLKASKLVPDEPTSGTSKNQSDKFEDINFYRQLFTQSYKFENSDCQIEYQYIDTSKLTTPVPGAENGLEIELICFKEARAEHYPVND